MKTTVIQMILDKWIHVQNTLNVLKLGFEHFSKLNKYRQYKQKHKAQKMVKSETRKC